MPTRRRWTMLAWLLLGVVGACALIIAKLHVDVPRQSPIAFQEESAQVDGGALLVDASVLSAPSADAQPSGERLAGEVTFKDCEFTLDKPQEEAAKVVNDSIMKLCDNIAAKSKHAVVFVGSSDNLPAGKCNKFVSPPANTHLAMKRAHTVRAKVKKEKAISCANGATIALYETMVVDAPVGMRIVVAYHFIQDGATVTEAARELFRVEKGMVARPPGTR